PDASIDYRTPSLMAVRWFNTTRPGLSAFARLGLSAIDNSASDARIPYEKQTSMQLAAGLGAQLRFARRLFLRADIDFYDRDHYYAGLAIGAVLGGSRQRSRPASVPAVTEQPEPQPETTPPPPPLPPPPAAAEPVCETVASVIEGVRFENNSDRLTEASRSILDEVVETLRSVQTDAVTVRAHTDSAGSDAYNLGLSVRRARTVADYLVTHGIDESHIRSEGLGEAQPVADNDTAAGRAQNRRVELLWRAEQCGVQD
ncbi:MAG: OmpA family protein, partial [Halioglobus sp.]|nr:OmpA family protein [Halioglobus sp.]